MCGVWDACSTAAELATASEELHTVRRAKLQQLYSAEREQSATRTHHAPEQHLVSDAQYSDVGFSLLLLCRHVNELRKRGLAIAGPNIA